MANVQKLSDEELSEAVDRIPLDLVAEDPPVVKEWVTRARAQRQLEKIGIRVTREEAIRISRQVLKDAERGRIEVAEREAQQGVTYMDEKPTNLRDRCAILELLKARQERRLARGDEARLSPNEWLAHIFSESALISDAANEPGEEVLLYEHVASLAAVCLAWLQVIAPATSQSRDE